MYGTVHYKDLSFIPTYNLEGNKQNKEEGKYQESIQSNTTPDPGHNI